MTIASLTLAAYDPTLTTVTAVLTDGTNYALAQSGWAPAIAGSAAGPGSGQGSYEDVEEEIVVNIFATSLATLLSKLAALSQIADYARRFGQGDDGCLATITIQMTGGSTVQALVTDMHIIAPRTYADLLPGYEFEGVTIRLTRRGLWVGVAGGTSSSSATGVSNVMSITGMTDFDIVSPANRFWLTGFDEGDTPTISAGVLAVTDTAAGLIVQNMSAATATGYTTQADSANLPRGGTNVLRYTPAGTSAAESGTITGLTPEQSCPVAILAVVRNNSTTRTFQIRANLKNIAGSSVSTPYQVIDTSSQQPRVVRLGIVRHSFSWDRVSIACQVDSITGSPTLDIDYVVLVCLRDETCRVIEHAAVDISALTDPVEFEIRTEVDSARGPSFRVYGTGASDVAPITYYDAIDVQSRGTALYCAWFATRAQYWRFTNISNAVPNLSANLIRHKGFLVPQ